MTPKEQELKEAISDALLWQPDDVRREVTECLLAKARECYSEELQAERMVTFKLSQQIETMLQLLVETKKMHLRYEENRDWLERRDKIIGG